jgi:cytochrome c oxidase subunit 2
MKRTVWSILGVAVVLTLSSCDSNQYMLNPAADQAQHIGTLWWTFVGLLSAVYALVILFTGAAIYRDKRAHGNVPFPQPVTELNPTRERRLTHTVTFFVILTTLALLSLIGRDFVADRKLHAEPTDNALNIKIVGHQWWWEVIYQDSMPTNTFRTANEIHVPVGRPIKFELESHDVIHSFWAPNLNGKRDLIPGHPTTATFVAEKPGIYRGQCAEYCGYQHANMRFLIVVDTPVEFENWLKAQHASAHEPATDSERHGREVFLGSTCVMCHSIQGTDARATFGPDLTHVGSRQMIAGASIPNTRGYLGGWILDPQHIKPGAHMPVHNLKPDEIRALIDYLQSLK